MSSKRVSKPFRMKAAEKLAAERAKAARPIGMGVVIERLAVLAAAEKPLVQVALRSEGAQPNNMAPSKYSQEDSGPIRILYQGIDSGWLNVSGQLTEDSVALLDWSKEDAQKAPNGRADSPLPSFDGTVPSMWAKGLPYYEWHANSNDVDVSIRKPSEKSPRAAAVVRVSAEALARLGDGGWTALALAAEWLRPLFVEGSYQVNLSHVHIATDFQGYSPVLADMENAVKRAGSSVYFAEAEGEDTLAAHLNRANRLTGISAGRSNNIRLNLYDKVLEIGKSAKDWMRDLWARSSGYVADEIVWRTEFQYGRDFLHERGIDTLDDLRANLAGLWVYGLGWYSFRSPGADTNRSRWPVAEWWGALASWRTLDNGELPKIKVVRPTWRRIAAALAGYAASAMALTGITEPAEALAAAFDHVESQHDPLGYADNSHLRYGRDSWPVMERKLAAKRLQYRGFNMSS